MNYRVQYKKSWTMMQITGLDYCYYPIIFSIGFLLSVYYKMVSQSNKTHHLSTGVRISHSQ
jgi:hypothetical protein